MQRQTRPPTSDGGHAAVGTSSGIGTGSSAVAGGGGGALEDGDSSGTVVGSVGGGVGGAEYDTYESYGPAAGDHTATRPTKSAPHARQVHSLYTSLATIVDVLETPSLERDTTRIILPPTCKGAGTGGGRGRGSRG